MKRFSILIVPVFLLALCSSAQEAKPSPAKRSSATSSPAASSPAATPTASQELKQMPKPEPPSGVTAAVSTLPVGTAVRMKLETALSTASTSAGDTFSGRIMEDVKVNDKIILPVGASLRGQVVRVSEPRRIKGRPMIQLLPESVILPNGKQYPISGAVVDTNKVNGTSVDDEGRIKGPGHTDRDVMEIGAGTGVGAIVGGIFGGGKGSLIGAGVGAGGTVIHWLTRRKHGIAARRLRNHLRTQPANDGTAANGSWKLALGF